jgi:hypothetical protein
MGLPTLLWCVDRFSPETLFDLIRPAGRANRELSPRPGTATPRTAVDQKVDANKKTVLRRKKHLKLLTIPFHGIQ